MSKPSKSQWDFGELFPVEATRHVLSVSDLTGQVRRLLEKHIGKVWVAGEISNLRAQSSGHIYFTLKDANAQLSCVLFRGDAVAQREFLQDGQKILVQGEMTVYEPRGQYQLRVMAVELQGVGALQIAFEKLKQKLSAEGLFAPERKRPLPRFPETIGLVTSPTGAAIRDVLHVIQRRNPALKIIFVPCRVQGTGAEAEIASAIRSLNKFALRTSSFALDLILVTRGGGSLEDLWAFNEEVVARAIFDSQIPVVSAVGHEIDFGISDFVADLRAATPSAAAEIITEGVFSSCKFVSEISVWFRGRTQQILQRKSNSLAEFSRRLARAHPKRRINEKLQRLDDLQTSLLRCVKHDLRKQQTASQLLRQRLWRLRPMQLLKQRREVCDLAQERLFEQARHRLRLAQNHFTNLETRLRLLSPEQVLARGYSITTDAENGKVIRDATQVRNGQKLKTRVAKGEFRSVVGE
jgi:exodeoxyribonuclease VII large subunit